MNKRLLLIMLSTALVSVGQAFSVQPALAAVATKPAHAAPIVPSPVKDEHVKAVPVAKGALRHAVAPQEPARVPGRGGLSSADKSMATTSTFTSGDASLQFLTRPYTTWHDITSVFDHCNPDYSTDAKVCRFDGTVGYRSNGVDPSFSLGYAQTAGGGDYLYYDGHNGWDYSMNYENVLSAADGVVRIAGTDSVNTCFGTTITIDHPNGFTTRYAHLSQLYVSSGQSVSRGQVIAQSGNTGCSSGPHLHFGVYVTSSWTAVDPWGWSGAPGADPWPSDPGNLWLTGYAQYPLASAPTNVVAIPGVQAAQISWTPPSFTGGSPITSYVVTSSPGGLSVTVPGTATSAIIAGLAIGTPFSFTVTAVNATASGASSATSNTVTPNAVSSFYFAEGSTNPGFTESLSILSPNQAGLATIDYFTAGGQRTTRTAAFAAGQPATVDVAASLGPNNEVSARVTLPVPGVVERSMHFNTGLWHGSTDQVGVPRPATEWDFAEGSTLTQFTEYLTLQNPNDTAVTVNLNYATNTGAHPVKTLALPANSRTTVEVFSGSASNVAACIPNGAAASCGVGRNFDGVSVQLKSTGLPIVAERPFYVNGFNFGSGVIRDGHDAFGANAPATVWNFAEGNTLPGFYEYFAVQNPGGSQANVTITYLDGQGVKTVRSLIVPASTRSTVSAFSSTLGVGPNVTAVSAQVTSDQPIVVERPIYMVHNFGSGPVAGAHVVVGANGFAKLFGFSSGSTQSTNHEFLTLQNPGSAANVTVTYYTERGTVVRNFVVAAASRHTVDLTSAAEGPGPGFAAVGIVISSDQPVLAEKATYDAAPSSYGATDTLGFTPASF